MQDTFKRATHRILLALSGKPKHEVRLAELRTARRRDFADVASRMRITATTIERQLALGLDNPVYRFQRDAALFEYLLDHARELQGCSWLDVGADTGALSVYLAEILKSENFTLCDVHVPRHTNFPIERFDGTALTYPDHSFDLVLFSYVLHHAGDNTIALLRDAHRIARRYVFVTEDPKETDADYRWAYEDDRRGTYRGLTEWRALLALVGFKIVHEAPLDCAVHTRHLFVLSPQS
jgi:SAM-dependent methyltransferase